MKKYNHRSRSGFTLAELIIGVLMGTILTAGISVAVINYIRSTATNIAVGEVQSQLRSALDYVAQDLRQARYIYRPPGTNCPTDLLTSASSTHYNTCPVDITSNKYVLPDGIGGGQLAIKPISGNNLAGVDRKARIVLAMWIPVSKGTYGTNDCNDTDYENLPDGELLSVGSNHWYPNVPPSDKWVCKPLGFNNRQSTGIVETRPAYMLVVYLTQGTGVDDIGPRILSRWSSPIVGISITDFGKGEINSSEPASATPAGYVIDPTSLMPTSKGVGNADIADYLINDSNTANLAAFTYNTLDMLNSRTYDLQIRADLKNIDNPKANNSAGEIDSVANDANYLMYRTTAVARNVCGGGDGDLVSCPEDLSAP